MTKLFHRCWILIFIFRGSIFAATTDFAAYYTKINSGEEFEKNSRTSEYADIVVNLDNGQHLVFWRGSSYLPYWQTHAGKWFIKEEIPRKGDGPSERPDNVNTYSQVEIIESNPVRTIIHWRYVPVFDATYRISRSDWTDEYFTIYPDGLMIRTIRAGTETLAEWEDPNHLIVRELKLDSLGIYEIKPTEKIKPSLILQDKSADFYINEGYKESQYCHDLRLKQNGNPSALNFSFIPRVRNPVIVVKNWGKAEIRDLQINSQSFSDFKVAYQHHLDRTDLIVWCHFQSEKPLTITMTPGEFTPPGNKPPEVSAGLDQNLLVEQNSVGPYRFKLHGHFEDDGLPNGAATVTWTKVSGPGNLIFSNKNSLETEVQLDADGLYVLMLTGSDGKLQDSDKVVLVIDRDPGAFGSPIAWWRFNETAGNVTQESVAGIVDTICGYSRRLQGVVGNGVKFSEYDTFIKRSEKMAPKIDSKEFSIEAWVAPRTYPWNWCPIVAQKDSASGYYFGMSAYGQFGLWIHTGGMWQRCETDPPYPGYTTEYDIYTGAELPESPIITLPLLKWSHIVATFSGLHGIKLYLNGELIKSLEFTGELDKSSTDFYLGRETEKRLPANTERPPFTDKFSYSFDGMIDEIKMYNLCLNPDKVRRSFQHSQPKVAQPMEFKRTPQGPAGPARFGIYHTTLKFDEDLDHFYRLSDHADKILFFDKFDFKVIWWHGIAYYPVEYAANGIGMQHEAVETHGEFGCEEALMDKQCRYAKVKVIEDTPARVVVEFRSASSDIHYRIAHKQPDGWGCWSDDLWTIYPDGTIARRITAWCSELQRWHSYEQENYVIPPGLRPIDILDLEANTVINLKGDISHLNWKSGWPSGSAISDGVAKTYNIKANAVPYVIGIPGLHDMCNADNSDTPLEGTKKPYPYCFSWVDHWPVEQVPSDGKQLQLINGHFSHSSTGAIIMDTLDNFALKKRPQVQSSENSISIPFLFGMTTKESTNAATALKLLPLAKMVNNPPILTEIKGCKSHGYDRFQHQYQLSAGAKDISFTLEGSTDSPIVNPCIVIKNWPNREGRIDLKINGIQIQDGIGYRHGVTTDTDGSPMLVLWIEKFSDQEMNIEISKS